MIRYYVSGLGYDEKNRITDYEHDFGDFDTYEEAYELFVRLQCQDFELFFLQEPSLYQLLLQVEESEEEDDAIVCIDVRNEWWITNPHFEDTGTIQISEQDFNALKVELRRAYDGLVEYAETLEDTSTCSEHLDNIDKILNKYKIEKVEE